MEKNLFYWTLIVGLYIFVCVYEWFLSRCTSLHMFFCAVRPKIASTSSKEKRRISWPHWILPQAIQLWWQFLTIYSIFRQRHFLPSRVHVYRVFFPSNIDALQLPWIRRNECLRFIFFHFFLPFSYRYLRIRYNKEMQSPCETPYPSWSFVIKVVNMKVEIFKWFYWPLFGLFIIIIMFKMMPFMVNCWFHKSSLMHVCVCVLTVVGKTNPSNLIRLNYTLLTNSWTEILAFHIRPNRCLLMFVVCMVNMSDIWAKTHIYPFYLQPNCRSFLSELFFPPFHQNLLASRLQLNIFLISFSTQTDTNTNKERDLIWIICLSSGRSPEIKSSINFIVCC